MNGTSRVDGLTAEKLIKNTQQLVFASPLYGVYENPDVIVRSFTEIEFNLPERLPLLAFDNQRTDEPLNLEKLRDLK